MISPMDTAPAQAPADMKACLKKPKAKLFPTPSKDWRAAKPYSEIFKEHKSRRRGKQQADCGTEAPRQGKILTTKVLFNPAREIQQNLLAGS